MRSAISLAWLAAIACAAACSTSPAMARFDDISNWVVFDPGANGLGVDPDGYSDAVFDGRFIYFAPDYNGTQRHGEVLRLDVRADFESLSSWAVYNPGANGVGLHARGFWAAVYDGRYVYFVPGDDGSQVHGEVLRYDTAQSFSSATSWAAFDPSGHGVGDNPVGYEGAVFDGRFVYFTPMWNGFEYHGEVLRLDTAGDFSAVSSWTIYEPGAHGVGTHSEGYPGGVFDGRYVYFSPAQDDSGAHGEVLRYDTTVTFSDISAWAAYDPGAQGLGIDPDGYSGAVFDGRYVYFVPSYNGSQSHSEVLRYDTTATFSELGSWATYNPRSDNVGVSANGFAAGVFDGRYIYFAPHSDPIPAEEDIPRYDISGDFSDPSSWAVFDPLKAGIGSGIDGRLGAVFDGRYVYFAPGNWHQEQHGEVLRYDTSLPEPIPTMVNMEWTVVADPGNVGELRGSGAGGRGPDRISGAVPYLYQIGKHEVTNWQYIEFLNAVARLEDTHGLYDGRMMGDYGGIERSGVSGSYIYGPKYGDIDWLNKPVNFVSVYDAFRFANWMHNGQPIGMQDDSTTEDGAYDMSVGLYVVRNPDARVFLPNEDECFKAAYYRSGGPDAGYWDYPTQSDTPPVAEPPPGRSIPPGSAHYSGVNGPQVGPPYYTTDVGAYTSSPGPYGTFDQAGNMGEWSEELIGYRRVLCGLPWNTSAWGLSAAFRAERQPSWSNRLAGFRLASVYDPDPRSVGFWKHQCDDRGFHQVSSEELTHYLSEVEARSDAFDECASIGCQVLLDEGPQNQMSPKTEKQLLALWLNVVSNRLPETTPLDLAGLSGANTVGEAITEIEATLCDPHATRRELEAAKDIAEAIPASIPVADGGGVIAYCHQPSSGLHQIFAINADGSGATRLIDASIGLNHHDWSPDGQWLAAVGYIGGGGSTWSIHTFRADGTGLERLTTTAGVLDTEPAWSPDGTRIAFTRTFTSDGGRDEVWVMNSDGSDQHHIGIEGFAPKWSPDGTRFVYSSRRAGNYEIYTARIDGSDEQQVTDTTMDETFPVWSPDGRRIAFSASTGTWNTPENSRTYEIYTMHSDGTGVTRLTDNDALDSNPRWSPDGSLLTFTSDRPAFQRFEVYVMNVDGSGVRRVTYSPAGVTAINPVWRPVLEVAVSGEDMELAVTQQVEEVKAGTTHEMTLGLLNFGSSERDYEMTASGPWQVRVNPERVEYLQSGDLALITVAVDVPETVKMGEVVEINITARDLHSAVRTQRQATVVLRGHCSRVLAEDGESERYQLQ